MYRQEAELTPCARVTVGLAKRAQWYMRAVAVHFHVAPTMAVQQGGCPALPCPALAFARVVVDFINSGVHHL